jgi:diadenosine tetraphosphate (Ap4A) HIT family hydrolase
MLVENCPLCATDGGALIWSGEKLRVIRAAKQGFPAFYRVVWNDHAAEFSDLSAADRIVCMDAVALVERVLREQLARPRSTWRLSVIWWRICTGM